MEYLKTHIGNAIAKKRKEAGLSQSELAAKCNFSQGSMANVEAGKQLAPIFRLYTFAAVLGCEIHDLLPTKDEFIVALFNHSTK